MSGQRTDLSERWGEYILSPEFSTLRAQFFQSCRESDERQTFYVLARDGRKISAERDKRGAYTVFSPIGRGCVVIASAHATAENIKLLLAQMATYYEFAKERLPAEEFYALSQEGYKAAMKRKAERGLGLVLSL